MLEFDAGHRLLKHEGKCRHVHGHRYRADITCSAASLDEVGRVIDFSVIKQVVGGWLDFHWDHGFIAEDSDPIIEFLQAQDSKYYMVPFSPTAENLAVYLLTHAKILLAEHGVEVLHVRLHETPTAFATAS
jgi:6-pyruvoyltetrahydropterin/6-carboxytetrahydropterin synthase